MTAVIGLSFKMFTYKVRLHKFKAKNLTQLLSKCTAAKLMTAVIGLSFKMFT